MSDLMNISGFLTPVDVETIAGDTVYRPNQIGKHIDIYSDYFPGLEEAELVLVGCGELRGNGILGAPGSAPDLVRRHFYSLFFWHEGIGIADIGNIQAGASYADTLAALQTVTAALTEAGKTVLILGGSHDLTLAQYKSYVTNKQIIEATIVDALIDLDMESPFANDHFLMEMLTGEPNYIRHYNHIGFQSYLVHPGMLQTLDKLKFDFFRVGHVKEDIEDLEPAIRGSHLFSFDINAIAHAYAPANTLTPNGFNGEEACMLMQYAGMSSNVSSIGIYGYNENADTEALTAKQIAHMLWYALDGVYRKKREADLSDREAFNEYQLAFSDVETHFFKSKKTGRWWMQINGNQLVPCSYKDYQAASRNEIPERWFRAQHRDS